MRLIGHHPGFRQPSSNPQPQPATQEQREVKTVMTGWSSAAALSDFERRAKNDSKLAWLVAVHFESLGPRERPLNISVFQPTSRTSTRSANWRSNARREPVGTLLRDEEMRKALLRQWTDMLPCDGGHDGRGAHGLRCAHAPFSALCNLAAPTTTLATN